MSKPCAVLAPLLLATATATATVIATVIFAGDASASNTSIALGEVAIPPTTSGLDHATLKTAAEGEIRIVDTSRLRKARPVVVSVAIIGSEAVPFGCTVNALVRDAKTGSMLAIIEGRAHAEGSANSELRKQVLRAALHSAVSKIPDALAAN